MKERLEEQLMLCCATTHLDERKTGEIRKLLDENIDWDYILANRSLACITPLIFYNLKKIVGRNTIPQSVVDRLRARYVNVLRRNMLIYRQLHEVLEGLQNEGVPVILLKGVALAETVYPDIALRPMSDIDVLIKKMDLHDAGEVLSKLGYTQLRSIEYYEKHHHLAPYVKVGAKGRNFVAIEIHHNIARSLSTSGNNFDWLWENAQSVNIAGVDTLILSPENLILHLCLHMSNACFVDGIKTLLDISESTGYYGGDLKWHLLIRRSKEIGISDSVYYPLFLAKEIMELDVPIDVLNELELESGLNYFEVRLLKRAARSNVTKNWYYSSTFSRFVIFLYKSLCRELLYTPKLSSRIRNFGLSWFDALGRTYRRNIKKEDVSHIIE